MTSARRLGMWVGALALASQSLAAAPPKDKALKVDPKLSAYKPTSGVSGNIKSVGSDTMNNLMTLWAEDFLKFYPNVRVEIEGKGSSTAPPALIAGTSAFGPMSREMKSKEVDDFEKRFGYKTADVRAVPLRRKQSAKPVPATAKWAYTGQYPLARFLLVYVNHKPGSKLDPLRAEYIRYMFSKKGQEDVIKDGYFPISARIAEQELGKLGLLGRGRRLN